MKLRVFLSSTVIDLGSARDAVKAELNGLGIVEVIRAEDLPASEDSSHRVCLSEVANADAIVVLFGKRYGFVPERNNRERLSVTHLEFREAKSRGKPVFAFPLITDERDPDLLRFVQEVSDFNDGAFRKEWTSVDDLRREVRIALLFFLLRRARSATTMEDRTQSAAALAGFPELRRLALLIDSPQNSGTEYESWLAELERQMKVRALEKLLPCPDLVSLTSAARVKLQPGIRLHIRPTANHSSLSVRILIAGAALAGEPARAIMPAAAFDAPFTIDGARFTAGVVTALALLAVGDWMSSVDDLLSLAAHEELSEKSRLRVLEAAAFVSAVNLGRRSVEVARRLLELDVLDQSSVSAAVLSLTFATARYDRLGATAAIHEADGLVFRLLTVALKRQQAEPESLYNLAKRVGSHTPLALAFYRELIRRDPSYDERWYVHRDIGVIHYRSENLAEAARQYDLAASLKPTNSELSRFAGDAFYYRGAWAEALIRFERAVSTEPCEGFFLDGKIDYAQRRLRLGVVEDRRFRENRRVADRLARVGTRAEHLHLRLIAIPLFRAALWVCPLQYESANTLALYANRRGDYSSAIRHLRTVTAVRPELPSPRLNLVMNLIFLAGGTLTDEAIPHLRAAIFHGGRATLERFRLRLINTVSRDQLVARSEEMFVGVEKEREAWTARRSLVLQPEIFGNVLHFELGN